jgi:hypothetical protein
LAGASAWNWTTVVNEAIGDKEMERLRTSVNHGQPLGAEDWGLRRNAWDYAGADLWALGGAPPATPQMTSRHVT